MKHERLILICLPYAGGSSYTYKVFEPFLDSRISVFSPELPGRNRRLEEACLRDAHDVTDDLFTSCHHVLQHPYMIYGHSMGALLAYLLTKKILAQGFQPPLHLICTGRGGPSVPPREEVRYLRPKTEFYKCLQKLGGITDDLLANESYMSFFEPILRADFEVVETYTHVPAAPLSVPITVVTGTDEEITPEEAATWRFETHGHVDIHTLPGDHFFINSRAADVCRIINQIKHINDLSHARENVISKA